MLLLLHFSFDEFVFQFYPFRKGTLAVLLYYFFDVMFYAHAFNQDVDELFPDTRLTGEQLRIFTRQIRKQLGISRRI
jgi:hypothetical protein